MLQAIFLAFVLPAASPTPSPTPASPALSTPAAKAICTKPAPINTPSPVEASPSPPDWRCNHWIAATIPFVHTQNLPASSPSTPKPPFLGELDAAFAFSKSGTFHASAFDRTPGTFAAYAAGLGALSLDPDFDATQYGCALCTSETGNQRSFVGQSPLKPSGPPAVPASAQLFSTVADLTKLAPANISADIAWNVDGDRDSNRSQVAAVAGFARGHDVAGNGFDDGYFVFGTPSNEKLVLSLAQAITNHVPAVPSTSTGPTRSVDTIVSLIGQHLVTSEGFSATTTLQYGSHGAPDGQTKNVMQEYKFKQIPENPWDLIVAGRTGDYDRAGYYTARGTAFAPSDAPADALVGQHGFAGEAFEHPHTPFGSDRRQPMTVDISGWRFGDVHPRLANVAAALYLPFEPRHGVVDQGIESVRGTGLVVKASRGYVAANIASANVATTPLADPAGGAALIPQSSFEIDAQIAGGHFQPNLDKPTFAGTLWSVTAGYSIASDPECAIVGTAVPCASVHHKHLSLNAYVRSEQGFLSASIGPATLASGARNSSTNTSAPTPLSVGDFINKNSWNIAAGLRLSTTANGGLCNTLVLSGSNTAPPPELVLTPPGGTLNIGGYLEVVPLRSHTPIAFFAGAAHTITNNAQPAIGLPATFGTQFVSTVTYSAKISFGSEAYRNHLRAHCTPVLTESASRSSLSRS